MPKLPDRPPIEVRTSKIQGRGVFATRRIRKGATIVEYTGERISTDDADARYDDDAQERTHTFLFTVSKNTVIDATREGSDARFINHSCEPNCASYLDDARIFIEAVKNIPEGTELAYDYMLERGGGGTRRDWEKRYPCNCGTEKCRETLLAPKKKSASRKAAKPPKTAKSTNAPAKPPKAAQRKRAAAP